MDCDQNPARLRQNLAHLQSFACRLEELAEKMSAHLPLTELELFLQISDDILLQILQFTDQIEDITVTELTHACHSQSSPAFSTVQLRCDEITTSPGATAPAILTQTDSSRSNSQQPIYSCHSSGSHSHFGHDRRRALSSSSHRRRQHSQWYPTASNTRSSQPTENSVTVTDHDNIHQEQVSSIGNNLQQEHCTSTTGSSLMPLQQQANVQTIPPQLPPLLHQQTFNNPSE